MLAHLFLKSWANLKASSGIQFSVSSSPSYPDLYVLLPLKLDFFVLVMVVVAPLVWFEVTYKSGFIYLIPKPVSAANSPKFLYSSV